MIERVYQFLDVVGYPHPLHPALTHMPIGLVFGALLLGLTALIFRFELVARAARYSIVIAFIFLFPTVLLGYMDWQHYMSGGWLQPIKIKLILGAALFVLLFLALIVDSGAGSASKGIIAIYGLCFLATIGLGFFGGQLVFAGKVPEAPPEFRAGQMVFKGNCSGCHPYGGNIADPEAPLLGSDDLEKLDTFLRFIRDPRTDSGKRGVMPPIQLSRVSDEQAKQLRLYAAKVFLPEKKPGEGGLKIPQFTVGSDPANIEKGKKLFEMNCAGCHTADSTESLVGPGLKGILKRQALPVSGRPASPPNVYRQLREPFKDMPSFARRLTDEQVFDLIAYLNTR
jgi:mono/diheme cytochrome c family protein